MIVLQYSVVPSTSIGEKPRRMVTDECDWMNVCMYVIEIWKINKKSGILPPKPFNFEEVLDGTIGSVVVMHTLMSCWCHAPSPAMALMSATIACLTLARSSGAASIHRTDGSVERCAIQSPARNKYAVSTGYNATFLKDGKGSFTSRMPWLTRGTSLPVMEDPSYQS